MTTPSDDSVEAPVQGGKEERGCLVVSFLAVHASSVLLSLHDLDVPASVTLHPQSPEEAAHKTRSATVVFNEGTQAREVMKGWNQKINGTNLFLQVCYAPLPSNDSTAVPPPQSPLSQLPLHRALSSPLLQENVTPNHVKVLRKSSSTASESSVSSAASFSTPLSVHSHAYSPTPLSVSSPSSSQGSSQWSTSSNDSVSPASAMSHLRISTPKEDTSGTARRLSFHQPAPGRVASALDQGFQIAPSRAASAMPVDSKGDGNQGEGEQQANAADVAAQMDPIGAAEMLHQQPIAQATGFAQENQSQSTPKAPRRRKSRPQSSSVTATPTRGGAAAGGGQPSTPLTDAQQRKRAKITLFPLPVLPPALAAFAFHKDLALGVSAAVVDFIRILGAVALELVPLCDSPAKVVPSPVFPAVRCVIALNDAPHKKFALLYMLHHIKNPYPPEEIKKFIVLLTGCTETMLNTALSNLRLNEPTRGWKFVIRALFNGELNQSTEVDPRHSLKLSWNAPFTGANPETVPSQREGTQRKEAQRVFEEAQRNEEEQRKRGLVVKTGIGPAVQPRLPLLVSPVLTAQAASQHVMPEEPQPPAQAASIFPSNPSTPGASSFHLDDWAGVPSPLPAPLLDASPPRSLTDADSSMLLGSGGSFAARSPTPMVLAYPVPISAPAAAAAAGGAAAAATSSASSVGTAFPGLSNFGAYFDTQGLDVNGTRLDAWVLTTLGQGQYEALMARLNRGHKLTNDDLWRLRNGGWICTGRMCGCINAANDAYCQNWRWCNA